MKRPQLHNVSTRRDRRSVPHRFPLDLAGVPGADAVRGRQVCENRLDGSAACPPITSRLSPPGYNLVLVECRHPRAVPLAFGDSAQFVGLAR